MLSFLKRVLSILDRREKRKLFWLLFASITVGLFEAAGIASIMPFMAVVGNQEVVHTNRYLDLLYSSLGFSSTENFLIFLGILVFVLLVLTNGMKVLVVWIDLNFVHFRMYSLSRRLLYSYLIRPYEYYLNQNTALLGKNILQEISTLVHHVLRPLTQIVPRCISILFILCLLFVVDPVLSILIGVLVGGSYIGLFLILEKCIKRMGEERFRANVRRVQSASEAFGAIKELKVLQRQKYYYEEFAANAKKMGERLVKSEFLGHFPSVIMELLAFGGILIIVLYFLFVQKEIGHTLPVIALYAFAGYRLMPAFQGIFSAVTLLKFNISVLDNLHDDIVRAVDLSDTFEQESDAMSLEGRLEIVSVNYKYPDATDNTIIDLNLIIEKNRSIGIVGSTGSGKTTLVDIILGLLIPQSGYMSVDGIRITIGNLKQWQRSIGYVPQFIFLADDSVLANIALGVEPGNIDLDAALRASKIANLHEFVTRELADGYNTNIGERGIRLSGGQRQRIGIARALYHNPEVLILDEATSALDGITEEAVIQAIKNLLGKKTIITIAHRLQTLQDCDKIYIMEKGVIVESGNYNELSTRSARFKAMGSTNTLKAK